MSESKQLLREEFKALRMSRPQEECNALSKRIVDKIRNMEIYQNSSVVAIYYPIYHEVDLFDLMNDSKKFCFPKIISFATAEMDFFEKGDDFSESAFGMGEPTGKYVSKDEIDLILVPGLVFSKSGYRIGYGKGFYDRYLRDYAKTTIGVAFDFQIVDDLPHDDSDTRLSMIVTSEG